MLRLIALLTQTIHAWELAFFANEKCAQIEYALITQNIPENIRLVLQINYTTIFFRCKVFFSFFVEKLCVSHLIFIVSQPRVVVNN